MLSAHPEGGFHFGKDPFLVDQQIIKLIRAFDPPLKRILRTHLFFHFGFLLIGILEIVFIMLFFSYLAEHSLLAFALALIFSTVFSYCILRLYCQTRKPEQLKELINNFTANAKGLLDYQRGITDCHIALADTFCRLAHYLKGHEYSLYALPFSFTISYLEQFSCWMHWHDIFSIQEMALIAATEEQIQLVKCDATSLETHTSLANAYVLLSQLYNPLYSTEVDEDKRWKPSRRFSKEIQHKFKLNAERAIEEFKILSIYAPHDPWVHEQLAYSYCDLHMPQEAIAEYELMLKFNPNDSEILYRLGILYFRLGRNAQGLQTYERLKPINFKKAEMLIMQYGAYDLNP